MALRIRNLKNFHQKFYLLEPDELGGISIHVTYIHPKCVREESEREREKRARERERERREKMCVVNEPPSIVCMNGDIFIHSFHSISYTSCVKSSTTKRLVVQKNIIYFKPFFFSFWHILKKVPDDILFGE
jgi:hypothetical protein